MLSNVCIGINIISRIQPFLPIYTILIEYLTVHNILQVQMSNNQIKVPNVLRDRSNAFKKIHENNEKVFGHVEYLRDVVTSMHQMYSHLCKKLMKVSDDCQRKIAGTIKIKSQHSEVIMQFVKSISFLHFSICNQLNSNTVTLGTKTHRIAMNRLDILKERLFACSDINQEYLKQVEQYNKNQRSFTEKCIYFNDYEKDVFKFYSLKANAELHDKLQAKQIKLKQTQEQLYRKKQDFQTIVHQLRAGIKDYFELQQNIISQYSKLLLNVRKIGNRQTAQLYAQPIMEEPSDEMRTSTNRGEAPVTHRSEKPAEKTIAQQRKEVIRQEEKVVALQQILGDMLSELQENINFAGQHIDEMRSTKEYSRFTSDKIGMSEILPVESLREIDLIVNQVSIFRTIIINLNKIFGKVKVLKEISKYRILNYQRFLEETYNFLQLQKKGLLTQSMRGDYSKYETQFRDRNNEYMSRSQQRIVQLQNAIVSQYYREEIIYLENKARKSNQSNIFQKPYYEILMDPFFLNRSNTVTYIENPYLKKHSLYISANQIQNFMTLDNFYKPKKKKQTRTCCGLFSTESQDEKPPVVDKFFCALKDGYVLIQGTLNLYENYFSFTSSFNPKTLFGYTDIRVPKWDVLQILNDTHLLNRKIVIETTHGNIEFTSFFDSPYDCFDILVRLYETKKNGVSTFHKNSLGDTEAAILEERFQSEFQAELLKVNIVVDKLSTYLSEDRQQLSVSIEYHPSGYSSHSLFEIKLIEKGYALEYSFIHDEKCKDNDIKNLLQSVSKQLINRKQPLVKTDRLQEIGKDDKFQCSIIEGFDNKLSFRKQPSFINNNGKEDNHGEVNLEEVRLSQLSLGPFLNSTKNLLQNSRNIEAQQESRLSPTLTNRVSSQTDHIIDNILLITPRTSSESFYKQNSPEEKQAERVQLSPIEEAKAETNESKRSKKSRKSHSKSASKVENHPNYRAVLIVVLVVFILNILLSLISS